jgi:general secretion pathway protein G
MISAPPKRAVRGASAFEFVVCLIIISILAAVLMDRLASYSRQAEVLAAQNVAENIRLSLRIRSAQLLIEGDVSGLIALADTNPVLLLKTEPPNYLGEVDEVSEELPGGNWIYQKRDKVLVYLLKRRNISASEGQKSLKFKVKLLRRPDALRLHSVPEPEGVVLEQIDR